MVERITSNLESCPLESKYLPLSPIIKVVSGGCNLRCPYCFYSGHQPEIKVMDEDTLEVVVKRVMIASPKLVTFYWHGGEPTIAGLDFYRKAIKAQERFKMPRQKVFNRIQTNGTLLNQEWVNFFRENNFGVGVSIDGPSQFHNLTRTDAVGKGTFNRVLRSINYLQEAGISPGAIVVVNKFNLGYPEEIFEFMYRHRINFSANPCSAKPTDPPETKSLTISYEEYSNFLMKLFDIWLKKDDPSFRIRPLEDIVKSILGGRPSFCKFRGECYRYLTIDSNGDIYPCDEFLETSFVLGNLVSQDLNEIFNSEGFRSYYSGRDVVRQACKECDWYDICNGGCMREWESKKQIFTPESEDFCKARQKLFSFVKGRLFSLGYLKEGGDKHV